MYYSAIGMLALLILLIENQDIFLNRGDVLENPAWMVYRKFLFAVVAYYIMDLLEMEGIEADHAVNGKVAVEMFEDSGIDAYAAVLMDVRMPEMDGLQATAAIRELDRPDARRVPIIALTANAFDEDVQRSMQAGMNAHLTKPVESDQLIGTLGELVYEAQTRA